MEWLENLKAGDEVVVENFRYGCSLHTVERVTKTMIVVGKDFRFKRSDGDCVGSGFIQWGCCLRPANDEWKTKALNGQLTKKLNSFKWDKVPFEIKKEVAKILVRELLLKW